MIDEIFWVIINLFNLNPLELRFCSRLIIWRESLWRSAHI